MKRFGGVVRDDALRLLDKVTVLRGFGTRERDSRGAIRWDLEGPQVLETRIDELRIAEASMIPEGKLLLVILRVTKKHALAERENVKPNLLRRVIFAQENAFISAILM